MTTGNKKEVKMGELSLIKPKTAIEKKTHTTVDVIGLYPDVIKKWKIPMGQRPLRENAKVRAVAEQIKMEKGVVPGILTLGMLDGVCYIIDGQHRIHAFLLSGLKEGFADVRYLWASSMQEIHREYVELNSRLVTMRPDDFLRGLEDSIPALQEIRRKCPFIGYDMIRRGGNGPIVSMSSALRAWRGSAMDTPSIVSMSAVDLAEGMVEEETRAMTDFMNVCYAAFGRDVEYNRLWTGLNLTICAWLYRRMVIVQYSPQTPRLTKELFTKCLMSMSADAAYQDWIIGRKLGERDRGPAYTRIRLIFTKRLEAELGKKIKMPQPTWYHSNTGMSRAIAENIGGMTI